MIPGDTLLDTFIDTNILLIVAFALWSFARFALRRLGLRHAFGTELKLLNGVFLAVILSPFLMLAVGTVQASGMARGVNLSFSDMVVAHYLNGGFEMKATDFEQLLQLRGVFVQNILGGAGWTAWMAIGLFLGGVVLGLGRLVYSVFCLRRIVSRSYAWRSFGRVRLRLTDQALVPFSTRGLRNYYVVIPSHMLGERNELAVSLAHEFQHLRQGDIEWEILLEVLKPIFFLNPAFHAWKRKVEELRELSCDAQVLTRGRIGVRDYCETLLSVCQKTLRRDPMFVIAVPKVTLVTADRVSRRGSKGSFLEERITSLFDASRVRFPRLVFAAMALPLILAILFTAVAIQKPGDWSHDRLMLSTVVNLERLEEINRLSTFGRIRN